MLDVIELFMLAQQECVGFTIYEVQFTKCELGGRYTRAWRARSPSCGICYAHPASPGEPNSNTFNFQH